MRRTGLILAALVFVAMPVGAGASGHSALAMLAFAALIWLGNAVMRPGSVRTDAATIAAQALTAGAFSALLVGLGQTVRALAGIEGSVDLFGWLFAGAWAVVLARLLWPPRMNDRIAGSAEAALREVHRAGERARDGSAKRPRRGERPRGEPGQRGEARPDPRPQPRPHPGPSAGPQAGSKAKGRATPKGRPARATGKGEAVSPKPERRETPATATGGRAAMTAPTERRTQPPPEAPDLPPVDALPPERARLDELRAALAEARAGMETGALSAALLARAAPGRPRRDRRALALHATDPAVLPARRGAGDPAAAFEAIVAAADAATLADFVALSAELLEADPAARAEMPGVGRLVEISSQIEAEHEQEAEALVWLAHRLEDLAFDQDEAAENGAENGADA